MALQFEILVVASDEIYERRGRIQRKAGIDARWFHHPDSLKVPEAILNALSSAFRAAQPAFNYYGPTEYKQAELVALSNELQDLGSKRTLDQETETAMRKILALTEHALLGHKSLLVLGI